MERCLRGRLLCALLFVALHLFGCGEASNGGSESGSSARDGQSEVVANVTRPTRLAWGPDGRLYVATFFGAVHAYRFDDDWNVVETRVYDGVSNEADNEILGIAFDPHEGTSPVAIYLAHANINSAPCGVGFFPYGGRVSRLKGPNFDTPEAVVTGLPASNQTHAVNGLAFDDFGDLYVSVGGVTNAGIPSCDQGGMPESPLSGAVVKVPLSEVSGVFDIIHRQRADDSLDDNQVNGATADVDLTSGVSVFASGLRNAYTLLFATTAKLYAVDNGADAGGQASTSATTQQTIGTGSDSLDRIVEDGYYGHPNRNRGRDDARQNVYVSADADPSGLGTEAALATFPASMNGLTELRSVAWGAALRDALIAQRWDEETVTVELAPDGDSVERTEDIPIEFPALDIVSGPGGALLGADFSGNAVRLMRAERIPGIDDLASDRLTVLDIQPWRAPAAGGRAFVIGVHGIDSAAAPVAVEVDGIAATVTRVSENRIEGIFPTLTAKTARRPGDPGDELVDITVTVAGGTSTLRRAFLPLPDQIEGP